MAHEITSSDSLLLHKQPAWHGLGTVFDREMTPNEAVRECLNWEPRKHCLYASVNGAMKGIPPFALLRSDNNGFLGVGSSQYQIIENSTLAKMVGTAFPGCGIESAGSLRGGRDVWFLVRAGSYEIDPSDRVWSYGLVTSSHDGKGSASVRQTSVRVVCANTLAAAQAASVLRYKQKHKTSINSYEEFEKSILSAVYNCMDLVKAQAAITERESKRLAQVEPSIIDLNTYFSDMAASLTDDVGTAGELANEFKELTDHPMVRLPHQKVTMWTAFNAVSHWGQHVRRSRGDAGTSAWFGKSGEINRQAFEQALLVVA